MKAAPTTMDRRHFLQCASTAATGVAAFNLLPAIHGAESPNQKVVVGVMGASRNSQGGDGRGAELAVGLAMLPGVEVAYICDVDERNVPKAIGISGHQSQAKPHSPGSERLSPHSGG